MTGFELFRIRTTMVQAFLMDAGYDGVLLNRPDNFAMATGGRRNYVNQFTDAGANGLFITREGAVYVVANAIEGPRQRDEELFDWVSDYIDFPWFSGSAAQAVQDRFTGTFVSDDGSIGENVHNLLAPLRAALTPFELEKYRALGALAASAMEATLAMIERGMTEAQIAAMLTSETVARECQMPVCLIAADERIAAYRHPLPTISSLLDSATAKAVAGYVMVVGGFQREGLVVSMTRFKKVAPVDDTLRERAHRIAAVDATLQQATRPNVTLGEALAEGIAAYETFGFHPNEWHKHHQGGATGYGARTAKAVPDSPVPVLQTALAAGASKLLGESVALGGAFAWNPSGPGVKSEDTFILYPDGRQEVVTPTPSLPEIPLSHALPEATGLRKWDWAE